MLPKEFEKQNFQILGVSGIRNIYGKKCEYKSRTPLLRPLFHFMRLISQPIALHRNHLAYQVLCIKNEVKQNGQCNKES